MSQTTFIVGIDGSPAGERALKFAKAQAKLLDNSKIVICYIIEWSPYSFQTAEENEKRHKRREEEITLARERILDPAITSVSASGLDVGGIVQHGDVAEILDRVAGQNEGSQIVVGRAGERGLKERIFGGVSSRLVSTASVPVTIIP